MTQTAAFNVPAQPMGAILGVDFRLRVPNRLAGRTPEEPFSDEPHTLRYLADGDLIPRTGELRNHAGGRILLGFDLDDEDISTVVVDRHGPLGIPAGGYQGLHYGAVQMLERASVYLAELAVQLRRAEEAIDQ